MRAVFAMMVTGALLGTAGTAEAQDAKLNMFLFERSYAALGTPSVESAPPYYAGVAEPALLAEAQSAVHLPLRRGLTEQEISDGIGWGFNLFLTPQFIVRGLDVPSSPVRSTSFMPKFVGQAIRMFGGSAAGVAGIRHALGITVVLGHHSNGGSNCEFVDEMRRSDESCVSSLVPIPDLSAREYRVEEGNFSTNYAEFGLGYRVGKTDSGGGDHWLWFAEANVSAQWHHNQVGFPLPGGPSEEFARLYDTSRWRMDVSGMLLLGDAAALRLATRLDVFDPEINPNPNPANYSFQGEIFVQPTVNLLPAPIDFLSILGVGVRRVSGQDFYNTQFVRDISNWQLMVVVDPWSAWLN